MLTQQLLKKIREDPGSLVGSIDYLDISSGNIGPTELILLSKALYGHINLCGACSPLIGINLRNNNLCLLNITNTDAETAPPEYKGFQQFCRALQASRYIKSLNLSENQIGSPGFKAISELLDNSLSLHELM